MPVDLTRLQPGEPQHERHQPASASADWRRLLGSKAGQGSGQSVEGSREGLRAWFKKKRFIIPLVLVAIIGISVAACGGSDDEKSENADEPAGVGSGENEVFALGQAAHTGDFDVTLNTVQDPFVPTNEFETPPAGQRFVAVELTLTNTSDERLPLSTLLGFELKDSQDRPWDITLAGLDLPQLDGEVPAGDSRKGWAVFAVAEDAADLTLRVKGSLTAAGSVFQL